MYFLLGISLILAFLLIANMLVALLASLIWTMIAMHVGSLSANTRAQIIFGLRLLPVAASLVFVVAFLIPAYVLHEPDESGEVVSGKLALLAAVSTLAVLISLYRVFKTWLVTRRLVSGWLNNAAPIKLDNIGVPIYRIRHEFPVIAVVGVFRPRMFVAEKVLESLEEHEFRAAVAHEYGHLRAKDNFKRTLLRLCRDLLLLPLGTALDRAWAHNAESAADEYAARTSRSTAIDLASALVKIARLVPARAAQMMPAGAFLIGTNDTDITARVRHLLRISENQNFSTGASLLGFSPASWVWSLALIAFIALPLTDDRFHLSTHEAIEHFVWILQ